MGILVGVSAVVGLISFFAFDAPSYIRDWYYSVYITPKLISIEKGDWEVIKYVQIVNNNPYPIFAVQLELIEVNSGSNIENVKIQPQPNIVATNFSTSTDMNAFVISGFSKFSGKKWKRSIIYQIDPRSQVGIRVTIPSSSMREEFKLQIADFRKEAMNILQSQGTTRIDFQVKN